MAKETSKGGKKEKRPKTSPPRTGWQFAGRTAKYALIAAVWLALGLVGVAAWYGWDLPDISRLETPGRRPSVTLVAENGAVLARYGQSHGGPIAFDDLPPHLIQAVVATEDRRFFDHAGFDPWAVARAMIANLRSGSVRQGGSTLTQQLAKNLFLSPERTIRRKVQELLAAFWLEARFSKQQIFAIYANRVYLGSATYGMEAAARRYFGKSVRDVTLAARRAGHRAIATGWARRRAISRTGCWTALGASSAAAGEISLSSPRWSPVCKRRRNGAWPRP